MINKNPEKIKYRDIKEVGRMENMRRSTILQTVWTRWFIRK